jgi:hypothetical protein
MSLPVFKTLNIWTVKGRALMLQCREVHLLPQSCLASLAQLKPWERNYLGSIGQIHWCPY